MEGPATLLPEQWSWKSLLPSTAGSALIHVLVFAALSFSFRGCQTSAPGVSGGAEFRTVGLVVVESDGLSDGDGSSDGLPTEAPEEVPENPSEDHQSQATAESVPSSAPSLNELVSPLQSSATDTGNSTNSELPSVIGAGAPLSGLPSGTSGATSDLIRANPAAGGAAQSGGAQKVPGQTTFMNIADTGRSFVYVVDVSSSMTEGNRLQIAKSQLKASLRLLQPNQFFQVVFYSEPPTTRLRLRGRATQDTYPATEVNLLLAEREIDRVEAQNGTHHMSALIDALSLAPDVIYFLTDGREPALSPAELSEVKRLTGKTTIHVIEFGNGALSSRTTSWLEKLARQSNGEYREFVVRD